MAKKQQGHTPQSPQFQNTSNKDTRIFIKGMQKDMDPTVLGKDVWTHCINCINNTKAGDAGTVSNEQGNKKCADIPYTLIGGIHLYGDKWVVFATDDVSSEVGLFDDSQCTYDPLINDPCLNFNKRYLVTGASKENFDCSWQVYWDDGNNPSRTLNLDNIPYKQEIVSDEGADCTEYANIQPLQLDCERLRLAPLVNTPTLLLEKSKTGGKLPNGSYQAFIAYAVNENKVTDYYASNVQALFDHESPSTALNIKLTNLDTNFDGYRLVILSNNQGSQKALDVGWYSTEQDFVTIGNLEGIGQSVGKEDLPSYNPVIEKSEKMYVVNEYLVRTGPTENFNFNYQCQANKIDTHWVSVEYPADYYRQGGHNLTFMRDEQYSFFIRWIYNTGDKTRSYHIPGRPPVNGVDDAPPIAIDTLNTITENEMWQVANTSTYDATLDPPANTTTYDGGIVRAKGWMGYWESSEQYPNNSTRWCELCGVNIRHHKMPDEQTMINQPVNYTARSSTDNRSIYVLGVEFANITWPLDNDDQPIPNIVGYEILVGDRTGSESIVSKGIIRSMERYHLPDHATKSGLSGDERSSVEGSLDTQGIFPNYPFNDLGPDPYLSQQQVIRPGDHIPLNRYTRDVFTYHSPDTSFGRPFLGAHEVKLYGPTTGFSIGRFQASEDHPQHKLIRNVAAIVGVVIGAGYAIMEMRGRKKKILKNATSLSIGQNPGPYKDTSVNLDHTGNQVQTTPGNVGGFPLSTGTVQVNITEQDGAAAPTPPGTGIQEDAATDPTTGFDIDGAAPGLASGSQASTQANENQTMLTSGQTVTPIGTLPTEASPGGQDAANVGDGVGGVLSAETQMNTTTVVIPGTTSSTSSDLHTAMNPVISADINTEGQLQSDGKTQDQIAANTPGHIGSQRETEYEDSRYKSSPGFIGTVFKIMSFLNLMTTGGQEIIDLIYELMSYQNYALKYNSFGLYGQERLTIGQSRHVLDQARYLANSFQNLTTPGGTNYRINNLQRPRTVILNTQTNLPNLASTVVLPNDPLLGDIRDNSKFILSQIGATWVSSDFTAPISSKVAAHYVGLKINIPNQYAQLDGIRQVPTSRPFILRDNNEPIPDDIKDETFETGKVEKDGSTEVLFGGDCYIARYSEKVIMPFFWDFLMGQPDGYTFNYFYHQNVPFTRFWYNSDKYNLSNIVEPITSLTFTWMNNPASPGLPGALHNLDHNTGTDTSEDVAAVDAVANPFGGADIGNAGPPAGDGLFTIKHRYMYTHCSGANDFFVETKINVGLRDWKDELGKRHYDTDEFADVTELFHAKIIKNGNFYRYDNSLQKDQMFTQNISYGFIQEPTYDPQIAEECWTHYPKRLIYSRQAMVDATKDMWRVFLPQDYVDFKNPVNTIKPINKTGAMILFPHMAPQMWSGINTLQASERDIILGDGGLFAQKPQNVVNADLPHEYGSCESSRSAINTPSGLFFISQQQGKIFQYTQGLSNIAEAGMKQWFNKYLPSRLLQLFPELENTVDIDNPVAGVGCQSVYDPNYDLVYFCKKDYDCVHEECNCVEYDPTSDPPWVINETECYGEEPIISCPEGYTLIDGECCIDVIEDPIWSCTAVTSEAEELTVINPSFEIDDQPPGEVTTMTAAGGLTPGPWIQCKRGPLAGNYNPSGLGQGGFTMDWPSCASGDTPPHQQTPDTFPFMWCTASWPPAPGDDGWLPAYEGKNYIGMTIQVDGIGMNPNWGPGYYTWQEGVSQELSSPMVADTTYTMTIALTNGFEGWHDDIVVSIWGGSDQCACEDNGPMSSTYLGYDNNTHNSEILWTSPALQQSPPEWDLYTATFTPTSPHSHIHIRIGRLSGGPHMTLPYGTGDGYVYVDAISSIASTTEVLRTCECPAGTDMYFTGTDTPATPDDCIECITGGESDDNPCIFGGCVECRFAECIEPTVTPVITPIDFNDFFRDISWTVSYDPKIKAWVSFHDWHPELTFPSLNHFLTTKTVELDYPYCPPPYIYDPQVGMCVDYSCPPGYVYNTETNECCAITSMPVSTIPCDHHEPPPILPPSPGGLDAGSNIKSKLRAGIKIDLFTRSERSKLTKSINITEDQSKTVFANLNNNIFRDIKDIKPLKFNIDLPFLNDQTISLSFEYANNKKKGVRILRNTKDGIKEHNYIPQVYTYRLINSDYKGHISFTRDKIYGLIYKDGQQYEITQVEDKIHAIYNINNAINKSSYTCDMEDVIASPLPSERSGRQRMIDEFCINMGVDIDYHTYQEFEQDVDAIADWIQLLIDGTNSIYQYSLNCTVELTILHIWENTSYDIINATVVGGVVTDWGNYAEYSNTLGFWGTACSSETFPDCDCGVVPGTELCRSCTSGSCDPKRDYHNTQLMNWNGIEELSDAISNGDVDTLQVISLIDLGGGRAYGIGGYCNLSPGEYGDGTGDRSVACCGGLNKYVGSWTGGDNITVDAYSIIVVGHELGHVVGAYHTQNCGAYEADPTYNYPGGTLDWCWISLESAACMDASQQYCVNPGVNPQTNNSFNYGTLMSYCHMQLGCGALLQAEFHPIVAEQRIIPLLEANATIECSSCVPPLPGCTDPLAENYNPAATEDDGSCIYREICGCKCDPGWEMVYAGTTNPMSEEICIQYGGTNTECIQIDCMDVVNEPIEPSYEVGSLWRHNDRCDVFTNYYDVQYGWEIEFVESVGQVVNTLRNVEYEMEAWLYKTPEDSDGNPLEGYSDCENKYHELDYNFNRAVIYNTEQVSGMLNLNVAQKNSPWYNNQFPFSSGNAYEILYKKEEQKYRFNQFWDTTANRGEIILPPGDFDSNAFAANEPIWHTELDGYTRQLNPTNLSYAKDPLERKKFRHYWNKILLRRDPIVSSTGTALETRNMVFKVENSNINLSFR